MLFLNGENNLSDLKQNITQKAKEIGFAEIGFARADILDKEMKFYYDWLDQGYHATMSWLERNNHKRENPSEILENAKTVIVTATNYNTDHLHPNSENSGKISRYAWGDDYHDVILPKLRELSSYIKEIVPNANSREYVDTGSILEKVWAEKAGIGWQGKNSLILNKKLGSWIFLGIIITDLEIDPDEEIGNFCGKCDACITSCPTGAIVAPKVVDSNKCISFWTIEAKPDVEIPDEIGKNLNGWVYGCDICQDVCPWNGKKKYTEDMHYQPRENEIELSLDRIKDMTQEEFSKRFKKSPIKRTKLAGLKRNAEKIMSFKNEKL
jgi:epoxyqueuosine reductase